MATIDQQVIGELRALEAAGSSGFLSELIDLFLREGKLQVLRLQEAFENQDAPRFERAAHRLKGSSGNLGAHGMSRTCEELQALAQAADWSRIADRLLDLEEEFRTVRSELTQVKGPA
jgi:HPt (histidine-containing phosphotransfer) domain-containing protein